MPAGRTFPVRLRTLAAMIAVVASGLAIGSVYRSIITANDESPRALPVIQADKDPFRTLPDDPGGMDIAGKDSALFNMIDTRTGDPLSLSGARLARQEEAEEDETQALSVPAPGASGGFALPPVPETRTESLFGMLDELKPEENVQPLVSEPEVLEPLDVVEKEALKAKLEDAVIAPPEQAPSKDDSPASEPETANMVIATPPAPVRKPAVAAVPRPAKPAPSSLESVISAQTATVQLAREAYYIQLASLRDEAAARAFYADIAARFPALVRGAEPVFPKADLGARGIFTRVQVGPFNEAEAKRRCSDYTATARGGTCLVVAR